MRRRGFTLIEALASLMLVAIVLPFVVRGIALSARGASDQDRRATAAMLAQTQLEEVLLSEAWRFGDAEGDFDETYGNDAQRYTWDLSVTDWQAADFRELAVTVRWTSGVDEKDVRLKTVVYAGP